MRVLVYGAGGVGGFYGSQLSKVGCEVRYIARGKHLAAIIRNGLCVKKWDGTKETFKVPATDQLYEFEDFDPDVVLLCVKNYDVAEAADECRQLGETTFFVTFQNGVDAVAILSEKLGASRVVGGVCRVVSFVESPGVIMVQSPRTEVEFGEWEGNSSSERVTQLAELFRKAEITTTIPENTKKSLWTKMVQMGSLGPVCAATRASMKTVTSIPECREILKEAMHEAIRIAGAEGVILSEDIPDKSISYLQNSATTDKATVSTARDIEAGKVTELPFLSGKIVDLGRKHSIPTPVHLFLYSVLLPQHLQGVSAS
mmetsp:Transcript_9462/g.28562  ORF Transcript_9462/g.28562 Transcript_9462/m.28562 type:complete len:314 (+) Transcript_9462:117-1058(+)